MFISNNRKHRLRIKMEAYSRADLAKIAPKTAVCSLVGLAKVAQKTAVYSPALAKNARYVVNSLL